MSNRIRINPAAWTDATAYDQGTRGVVEPRVWELRTGPVRLIVHRLHGYDGWIWFGSCPELKIDRTSLAATSATEAQSELMTLALEKARGYVQALELAGAQ
ncbi:MAG TPA: hypothetical protein VFO62_10640 [Candidatus Binatia bacterium]|nr:hypothetical protein [Candidatus Binatia bacterium]